MVRVVVAAVAFVLTVPSLATAWGFEAHRFIAERMIALLPAELRPLFEEREALVVEHSIDPDLWRNIFEEEGLNHFIDLDHFGKYPFEELPREYDRAVQRWGREVVHAQGLLPWRAAEMFVALRRAFEALQRDTPPGYVRENIVFYATVLGHYAADAHVPLHAVVNHDGQLTNQRGLHSRWESELFERTRAQLTIAPEPPRPITDPRGFMFDTLLASNRLAQGVLEADREAATSVEFYDDRYFEAFGRTQIPVLEQRLSESITAVSSLIIGAWEAAGRPAIPPERPRRPRRVPPPHS